MVSDRFGTDVYCQRYRNSRAERSALLGEDVSAVLQSPWCAVQGFCLVWTREGKRKLLQLLVVFLSTHGSLSISYSAFTEQLLEIRLIANRVKLMGNHSIIAVNAGISIVNLLLLTWNRLRTFPPLPHPPMNSILSGGRGRIDMVH